MIDGLKLAIMFGCCAVLFANCVYIFGALQVPALFLLSPLVFMFDLVIVNMAITDWKWATKHPESK